MKSENEFPKRKKIRLQEYDYSTSGSYFITVCVKDRKRILWDSVGADIIRPNSIRLSEYGFIVEKAVENIAKHYENIAVDKFSIMPDHVHLIISSTDGRIISAPTVSRVVGQMKRWVSKEAGFPVWQKSFFDHIIRNENDYAEIWQYIEHNPEMWIEKHHNQTERLEIK
ncbi:MAG: transposase [Clostridia bacterium]|nr:transposase [Clostridia bacterium]